MIQSRITTAFRILADCNITEEQVARVVATNTFIHIHLDDRDHSSTGPMVNASRQLGVTPALMSMDTKTGQSTAHIPLDEMGNILLVGDVGAMAQTEWPEAFSLAMNEALTLEQMSDDAAKLPF